MDKYHLKRDRKLYKNKIKNNIIMKQRCFIIGLFGTSIGGLTGYGKGAAIDAVIGPAIGIGTGVLIGKGCKAGRMY